MKLSARWCKRFSVTFRICFVRTTENYPFEPVHQVRYRGHVSHRDEFWPQKCEKWMLSARGNCIYIEAAESTHVSRISAGERYASVYNIDYSAPILRGYRAEACPIDAITHGHGFELATYDINSLIYRKEQLLEKQRPPQHRALKPLISVIANSVSAQADSLFLCPRKPAAVRLITHIKQPRRNAVMRFGYGRMRWYGRGAEMQFRDALTLGRGSEGGKCVCACSVRRSQGAR